LNRSDPAIQRAELLRNVADCVSLTSVKIGQIKINSRTENDLKLAAELMMDQGEEVEKRLIRCDWVERTIFGEDNYFASKQSQAERDKKREEECDRPKMRECKFGNLHIQSERENRE
jgi:hypothetical protein